jgi:hypothetical protein
MCVTRQRSSLRRVIQFILLFPRPEGTSFSFALIRATPIVTGYSGTDNMKHEQSSPPAALLSLHQDFPGDDLLVGNVLE